MKTRVTKKRSPHNRRTRGLCAALLFIFVFGAVLSLPATAAGLVSAGNTAKISADLLTRMEQSNDPDELFSVDVWLTSVSTEAIDAEMKATYGISLQAFENEEIYETQTLSAIEAEAAQVFAVKDADQPVGAVLRANASAYGLERAAATDAAAMTGALKRHVPVLEYMSDKTLERGIETEKTALEIYQIAKSKQFKSYRNASVKKLITAQNDSFLAKLSGKKYTVTYEGSFVAVITMLATEETVRYASTLPEVTGISLFEDSAEASAPSTRTTSMLNQAADSELSAEARAQMAEMQANNTSYTGYGVTIGVLEIVDEVWNEDASRMECREGIDTTLPQLLGADIYWYPYEYETDYPITGASSHAAMVVSTIVARNSSSGYDFEEGIAPDAQIIGSSFSGVQQFREAMENFAEEEIEIISVSAGFPNHISYGAIDTFVDNFIVTNNISVVLASGNINNNNNGKITSPAHSYNAIVVGSAALFLDVMQFPLNATVVAGDSCYIQYEEHTASKKPDLCAFATATYPAGEISPTTASGSSFAAPRVAATIALMIQAKSSLRHQIAQIKAILLAAASSDVSSDYGNGLLEDSSVLRQRSGAGLLDIEKSCELAASGCYYRTVINLQRSQFTGEYTSFTRDELNVVAGQKIRVAMWFTKSESEENELFHLNPNNLDLYLTYYYDAENSVASSISIKNNVEVIEYTATQTGSYYIRINLANYEQMPADSDLYSIMQIGVSYCVVE